MRGEGWLCRRPCFTLGLRCSKACISILFGNVEVCVASIYLACRCFFSRVGSLGACNMTPNAKPIQHGLRACVLWPVIPRKTPRHTPYEMVRWFFPWHNPLR